MHINEAYEHTPILPYSDDQVSCPVTGCAKTGTQCVNVSQPVVLTPVATVGTVTTFCTGVPTVTCVTNSAGTACTVTLTQRVCASIPVTFGVNHTDGDPTISCAAAFGDGAGADSSCLHRISSPFIKPWAASLCDAALSFQGEAHSLAAFPRKNQRNPYCQNGGERVY